MNLFLAKEGEIMKKLNQDKIDNTYQSYIRSINRYPVLSFSEEQELARKVENGNKGTKEKLIKSNLKLVIKIAMYYHRPKYDLMDLIQEGNIGLMIAVDKFDYRKRLRFSTYSSWWIKHYIVRNILHREYHINIPFKKASLLPKLENSIYNLQGKLNRLPNIKELERELHINANKIKDMMVYIIPMLSLDKNIGTNSNLNLIDTLSSKEYQPEDIVFNRYLAEYELKILNSLVKREGEILKYRYGFYNGINLTLREVAKIFNITSEGARLIELRALKKIRANYRDLKDFLVY